MASSSEQEDPLETREQEVLDGIADSSPGKPLVVRVQEQRGVCVVWPEGELDLATAGILRAQLLSELERNPRSLIVDLSRTTYIDSTGLAVIIRAARELHGTLAVVTPRERIQRLFQATGLNTCVALHRSLDEALSALSGG